MGSPVGRGGRNTDMESKIKQLMRRGMEKGYMPKNTTQKDLVRMAIEVQRPQKKIEGTHSDGLKANNDDKSLRLRIADYAKQVFMRSQSMWISGDTIERLSQKAGYKASTGSRRARELADDGILERRDSTYGYVEYRYSPFRHTLETHGMRDTGDIISNT